MPIEMQWVEYQMKKLGALRKHYDHDQRAHGNWARGLRVDPTTPGRVRRVAKGVRRDKDGVTKLWDRAEIEAYAGVDKDETDLTKKFNALADRIESEFGVPVKQGGKITEVYIDAALGTFQALHDIRGSIADDIWGVVRKRLQVNFDVGTLGTKNAMGWHTLSDNFPEGRTSQITLNTSLLGSERPGIAFSALFPEGKAWTTSSAYASTAEPGERARAQSYATFIHEMGHHLMDAVGGKEGWGAQWAWDRYVYDSEPRDPRFAGLSPRLAKRPPSDWPTTAPPKDINPTIPAPKTKRNERAFGPSLPTTFESPKSNELKASSSYMYSLRQGVTEYSGKNPQEMYAESFAMWMLFGAGGNQLKGSERARWAKAKLGSATNFRNWEDQIVPLISKAAGVPLCGTCGSSMPIEMQWVEYQMKKLGKPVRKGDKPGHKFRGNQHTGGISDPSAARLNTRALATYAEGLGPGLEESIEVQNRLPKPKNPPPPDDPSDLKRRKRPKVLRVKDMDKAAKLAALGYVVEVDSVDEAHTLIEELARMAVEASKSSGKKISYNLCNVTVGGTNLFCNESYDLARTQMPQFSADLKTGVKEGSRASKLKANDRGEVSGVDDFKSYARSKGYKLTNRKVQASRLKATQKELGSDKVGGMMNNEKFDPEGEPIFVSRDGYVIDGHHRWASQLGRDLRDGKLGDKYLNVIEIDAPITEIIPFANQWATAYGFLPQQA